MQARRREFLMALAALSLSGCMELDLNPFFDKDKALEDATRKNVREALNGADGHSRLIGDYIRFADSTTRKIKVQGVGLVDRLDGTGEDPPASPYRTMLLEDMRRHKFKDPQTFLASADTALVIVTAYIDPVIKKGEKIDVEVTLPSGTESTSLAGGWLMPCHLRELTRLDGEIREGREIAIASGAILIDALGTDAKTTSASSLKGKIPGGAVYSGDDRLLTVGIGREYQTVRMSTTIANRIGRRFHDYDSHGVKRPLATAKTDSALELIVHDRYRDNWPRYVQCIQHMALTESPVEKHMRLQRLSEEVVFGPTAEKAALQLEAIGPEAIPTLKKGLSSPQIEARFHSGMALAYLGNSDGVKALREAADQEPAFRIYALAAMATLQDGASAEALRSLMSHKSVETRYGAFRSLQTMSPHDPAVAGVTLPGNFTLHVVESTAQPLIHITRYKRAEIVVFGTEQKFQMPLMLRAGKRILLQGSGSEDLVSLKRIAPGEPMQQRQVSSRVIDVLKAATDLGATYADVVEMLMEAERQRNLPGLVAVDQLPMSGRVYERPAWNAEQGGTKDGHSSKVQVGGSNLVPNMFDKRSEPSEGENTFSFAPTETEEESSPEPVPEE